MREIKAWDMDGTLCNEVCWTPKQCLAATPNRKLIERLNSQYHDCITIIHTARRDDLIPATIQWLRENGARYWGINNQKMPADCYIDDHALNPHKIRPRRRLERRPR